MQKTIENLVVSVLGEIGLEPVSFVVEHPTDLSHGDYSTNIAMVLAKKVGKSPRELAEEIKKHLESKKNGEIEKIEVAGAGFINFYLTKEFFNKKIGEIINKGESFGKTETFKNKKFFIEHTQPNPFKEFHIGHLMNNAIGESVSRIVRANGGEVKTATYHGDKGLHVAKAVWAMKKGTDLMHSYAEGNKAYDENEEAKKEIIEINKKIYNRTDEEINALYEKGRKESFDYFESLYKRLNSNFDYHFFESESGEIGKEIVKENIGKVFEESDGAVVFKGENFGLHTRVFLSSEGLPTYEAKEVGLAKVKKEAFSYDQSVTITASEQDAFFYVVEVAIGEVFPELKNKLKHLSHGMLRLPSGKMSSRTGDVITAEWLIDEVKKSIEEKDQKATDDIAISAIKYMILRQSIGNNIVFDFETSLDTEGDSGPYLQYAHARTSSILQKAREAGIQYSTEIQEERSTHEVEKLLYRFPEVVERAGLEYAPHYITSYLTELSGSYNNFYANERVISEDGESPYRLAITEAFNTVMKNGLNLLGIAAPEKM
jgi:arginyl-tRNA synthetase